MTLNSRVESENLWGRLLNCGRLAIGLPAADTTHRGRPAPSVLAAIRPQRSVPSFAQNHHLTTLANRPYDEISRYFKLAADFARPAFAQKMATRQFVFVRDISI